MKALSILDEVIGTIRASKDKRDAKNNLIDNFDLLRSTSRSNCFFATISINKYRYYRVSKRRGRT